MFLKHLRASALAALAFASTSALADYAVDILEPASPMALDAYNLHWGIMWVCVAIFFIVFGAMFWSVFTHRRSKGAKAAQFHENFTIEVIWTVIPLVVLVAMAWPATRTMLEMKDASNADLTIKVTAYQWRWNYDYLKEGVRYNSNLATPRDQIEEYHGAGKTKNANYLLEVDRPVVVPVNKKVRLLITSNDVIHGWYVPQLGVNQYGIPGFVKDAWFTATKVGTFRGQCSQICGKEHAYMPIVVEVKGEADYAKWVEGEKAKMPKPEAAPQQVAAAAPAAAAGPVDGKATYEATCNVCHGAGVAGAPKLGDKAAWAPRIKQGIDALHNSALKGKGAMPPKGGNAALSDEAVKAAVDHMVAAAK
ncbi:MAG TPA: cytochrome c oxidase subunit II [Usitatibacter sp.]|jgi:cytochrome c oxidase subunit 2|nr:cytochrome c oxidase subunit II [Usitatibacter sp.]